MHPPHAESKITLKGDYLIELSKHLSSSLRNDKPLLFSPGDLHSKLFKHSAAEEIHEFETDHND